MAPATPRPVALGAIPWEGVGDGPLPEPEVSLPPLPPLPPLPSVEDGLEPPSEEVAEVGSGPEVDSEPEPVEEPDSEPDWEPETSV